MNKPLTGLEVEMELKDPIEYKNMENIIQPIQSYLIVKDDYSLRNIGIEIVLSEPLPPNEIKEKIFPTLNELKNILTRTERTSIHFHINVSDLTLEQTRNLINWFRFFERNFYTFVFLNYDINRAISPYCIPTYNNPIKRVTLANYSNFLNNVSKYNGINFKSILYMNSIEIRIHPGLDKHDSDERLEEFYDMILFVYKLRNTKFSYRNCMRFKNKFILLEDFMTSVKEYSF